jgi:hypothetical protein
MAVANKGVGFKFVGDCIFVAIAIIVVDKASHEYLQVGGEDRIVESTMGFMAECIKVDATIEIPNGRGGLAALPSAKDWEVITVLVVTIRDSHLHSDSVYSLLEHIPLDRSDILMKAKGATNDACEVDNNNVIVASDGIIGEFQMTESQESAVLVVDNFDTDWIEGGSGCPSANIAIIDGSCVFSLVLGYPVLRAD